MAVAQTVMSLCVYTAGFNMNRTPLVAAAGARRSTGNAPPRADQDDSSSSRLGGRESLSLSRAPDDRLGSLRQSISRRMSIDPGMLSAGLGMLLAGLGMLLAGLGMLLAGLGMLLAGLGMLLAGLGMLLAGLGMLLAGLGMLLAGLGMLLAGLGMLLAGLGMLLAGLGSCPSSLRVTSIHLWYRHGWFDAKLLCSDRGFSCTSASMGHVLAVLQSVCTCTTCCCQSSARCFSICVPAYSIDASIQIAHPLHSRASYERLCIHRGLCLPLAQVQWTLTATRWGAASRSLTCPGSLQPAQHWITPWTPAAAGWVLLTPRMLSLLNRVCAASVLPRLAAWPTRCLYQKVIVVFQGPTALCQAACD